MISRDPIVKRNESALGCTGQTRDVRQSISDVKPSRLPLLFDERPVT